MVPPPVARLRGSSGRLIALWPGTRPQHSKRPRNGTASRLSRSRGRPGDPVDHLPAVVPKVTDGHFAQGGDRITRETSGAFHQRRPGLESGASLVAGCAPVNNGRVNAAERFIAASRAHDVAAAAAELAPDVVMLNPASDEPIVGRESVAAALRAVDGACDEFRHTHLLVDAGSGTNSLVGLVFEARVGDATLRGVDLVEIDVSLDRISTFTVVARPIAALMALGTRMSGGG